MKRLIPLVALAAVLVSSAVQAQGLLVVIDPDQAVRLPRPIVIHPPRPVPPSPPPSTYKIKELAVQAKLADQVAKVQVSQSFVNTGSRQMEVCFMFPLPYDGAIDQLTLLVDGKEFPAKLLSAKDARREYEAIVRKNQDPALLEWVGTGMFKTSVFPVPPGAERKVTLSYNQLLRKDHSLTDFLFPLSTAKYTSQPVESVEIRVAIESGVEIKNVYSPTHSIEVKRPDDKHAVVTYTAKNHIPTGDFRLFFDVAKGQVGASVISYRPSDGEDGYFLLLASPQIKSESERPKKTVLFVLDRSGSMSGKKFEQAKAAVKFVLNNLREGDLFNIVAYDSNIESFKPELERYTEETRSQALGYVEGLYPGGGTNIEGALRTGLSMLKDGSRPNYVIFLTDGIATAGETNEGKIVASSKSYNQINARVISFGVGYDLNSRLLDRLTIAHRGQSEYVRPDEDVEAHVSRLYSRISSPIMTDMAVKFEFDSLRTEEGQPVNRVFPKDTVDLFAGEQLVLVGRYRKSGTAKVMISGKVAGKEEKLDFPAQFAAKTMDDSHGFVEKLWAMRRIGDIIDELDLKGHNEELVKELVGLSTKHGILTPYTSFLADENTNLRALTENARRTTENLTVLSESEGRSGVAQRSVKAAFKDAQLGAAAESAPTAAAGSLAKGANLPALAPGSQLVREAKTDKLVVVNGVQNVGNKAFYCRGADRTWVDSSVTEEMEKNAVKVTQFSDDYFKLAEKHGKRLSQYLVFDEPALVNLDGACYRIEPTK